MYTFYNSRIVSYVITPLLAAHCKSCRFDIIVSNCLRFANTSDPRKHTIYGIPEQKPNTTYCGWFLICRIVINTDLICRVCHYGWINRVQLSAMPGSGCGIYCTQYIYDILCREPGVSRGTIYCTQYIYDTLCREPGTVYSISDT